jgi:type I restriction enzyme M protein
MAGLLEPQAGAHICDPTCGSGGLLLQCLARAGGQGVNVRSLFLYGQELNPETWAIARMNMLLHGAGDAAEIKLGDTLASPAFIDGGRIMTFDILVANPPFSSKNWGHERLKKSGDPYRRIKHLPSKSHGEMAFLQHMVASMSDGGRLAVVLPNGCFFRGGAELAVRKELVDTDLIESIVQLPEDLFYGSGIPACILLLNRAKAQDRKSRVLMIDTSIGFQRRETKNVLTDAAIERVIATYQEGVEEDGLSRWTTDEEIMGRHYNLTVRRYVGPENDDDRTTIDLGQAIEAYREAREARERSEARLDEVLMMLEEQ